MTEQTTETKKTATFVQRRDANGEGRVYRMDPPHEGAEYVWVSAVNDGRYVHETYIFACDEKGRIESWGELPGSIRGTTDHEAALLEAGYEVAR